MAEVDATPRCLLDLVPGASAAFGLRCLRAGMRSSPGGPIVRLTRRGDGCSERFALGNNGDLDPAAIAEFLGGDTARCDGWYDQSGNRNDAEPVAAAPIFDSSSDASWPLLHLRPPAELCSPVTLEGLTAFSIFAVFRVASVGAATSVARWQKEGDFVVFPYHTGEALVGHHNAAIESISLGVVPGEFAVYGVVWNQGAPGGFATYRNGSLVARRPARDVPIAVRNAPLFIGSYAGMGEYFTGDLAELVIWPRALSLEEIGLASENMRPSNRAPTPPEPHAFDLMRRMRKVFELDEAGLARLGMERLAEEIDAILGDPLFAGWPLDQQVPMIERIKEIYTGHWHASGHSLIPAIERVFHRAVTDPDVTLDALCLFYDLLYFLYWYVASDFAAMRGVADNVMKPFAAAIRAGVMSGLPAVARRTLGREPMRLGYLSQFARLGNPIGPCAHALLGGLSRHLPGKYQLYLYAWSEHDDAAMAALAGTEILVRRFTANSMAERISAVAEAIAADEIDILITDMNTALPTVLFERRVAPVQIFFQVTLPFWPLANIDGAFLIDFPEPEWQTFASGKWFEVGLGPWGPEYAPEVDRARVTAERARFPSAAKLVGTYVRFAKITTGFLDIAAELLARHPQLVVVLGGTGDGKWIRDFIAARGLAGRLLLIEEYVDGHVWGHMLDVFLDTFPIPGGVAGREVMSKGRPVVTMRLPWVESERVEMLTADDAEGYIAIVSRLIENPAFYEAACAATRDFVASQPDEARYTTAIDRAIAAVVRGTHCSPP